ncbi:DUF4192 domain-containing protein [Sphaerisporangium sp. TRM90804]|uniref:DUF4192 domain-containing protein n=1 Tax=Sphaerisporangium sp. TRM90804 TaxID=3031113 RepID=UPI0024489355|nr:DUF4192 domain-containing protein [Sphaerisporangium sp. TRM90804]MDH2428190.1 DUF4192 domain-containing protein [Sphaerisporangium sp. TRM90804]
MTASPILLTSPDDILGAVPYLLGFHPSDSLVIVGFRGAGARGRLRVTTRWDLPVPPDAFGRLVPLLRREKVTHTIVAAFGPGALVTPAVREAMGLLAAAGIEITEALRAEDGRYWSYVCERAECCPPTGRPYDPVAGQVAAQATFGGLVALPGRESLERSIAATGGPARVKMREATRLAADDVRARLLAAPVLDDFPREFVSDGLARVHRALEARRARLPDHEAASLGLALTVLRVRDEAWTLMDDATQDDHISLWGDLTRRLEPPFVPPAASLLAAAAWRRGDCALAGIAVERALSADPSYSMALLLAQGLSRLLGPEILRTRLPTPAQLDESMGPPRMEWLHPLLFLLDTSASALRPREPARTDAPQ